MTTLITGGTGRTGFGLAKLLHAANYPVVIASRSGEAPAPFKTVKFDFYDATTHEAALSDELKIDQVYIVIPPASTGADLFVKFVNLAISKGVKRFALLSATLDEPDANARKPHGVVHQQLLDAGVDYTILRPTWYIQNFDSFAITPDGTIFSAANDGKIPFVSVEDVSQAAFEGLTAEKAPNKDIFVVGPELLTYEDAAKMISSELGKPITYIKQTVEEQAAFYIKIGVPSEYANILARMDGKAAQGSEEALFNSVAIAAEGRLFVGKHTLREFLKVKKNAQGK